MTEPIVNPLDNSQVKVEGQVKGNEGQQVATQVTTGGQPPSDETIVELPGGEKVAYGELKKQRMLEADYRKKTAEVAEEKRRIEAEKQRLVQSKQQANVGLESYQEGEEPNPLEIIVARQNRIEAVLASNYLKGEIQRLSKDFPNADPDTVFKACWNDPNANIQDEMQKDHDRIAKVQTSHQDQLLTPEKEAEIGRKAVDAYLAKKGHNPGSIGGVATGGGSQIVSDPQQPPSGYDGCKEKLKTELAGSGSID